MSDVAWHGDGFYYSRYPEPPEGHEKASINENHQVFFHALGTPQSQDALVYEDPANPQRFHTRPDDRGRTLRDPRRSPSAARARTATRCYVRDLSKPGSRTFAPLIPEITNDTFNVVDNVGDKLLVATNHGAPNWRVVLIDPANTRARRTGPTCCPSAPSRCRVRRTAGGKLFATYLKDVTTRAYVYRARRQARERDRAAWSGLGGRLRGPHDDDVRVLHVQLAERAADDLPLRHRDAHERRVPRAEGAGLRPRRRSRRSRCSTAARTARGSRCSSSTARGCKLDGTNPTLLYGYGGFNIVVSPTFSAARIALLEQGVVYASANLRGGGEYGETWHQQGMKLREAERVRRLHRGGRVADREQVHVVREARDSGRQSNGGLLVGAVMNQRPELFRVGIPQVGVMDMLRFHKFTIGWNWVADYGSSDDPEEFKALYAYSPLHNIKPGVRYPATLITTADHDDRVVPGALVQVRRDAAGAREPRESRPDPDRDEVRATGASNLTKQLETTADVYAFMLYNLGVT